MNNSFKSLTSLSDIKPFLTLMAIFWSLAVAGLLLWNISHSKKEFKEIAKVQARNSISRDIIYRQWNAGHGGVYVPVTKKTQPNPYLKVAHRDIKLPSGILMTLINPAYMIRQVHEIAAQTQGIQGHMASLDPLRPGNAPDKWEIQALKRFKDGSKEVSSLENMNGVAYLRLMKPLLTREDCLKCHTEQGYKVGDIIGGLSVSVPMSPLWSVGTYHILTMSLGHGLLWLVGLAVGGIGARHLSSQMAQRQKAEEELRENEKKYRTLIDNIIGMVYRGKSDWSTEIVRGCESICGYTCDEFNSQEINWLDLIHPDDKLKVFNKSSKLLDHPSEMILEYRIIAKDGSVHWVRDSKRSYSEEGVVQGIDGIVTDISRQKQVEEEKHKLETQLQQSQKMESIGNLAGGIAHDFNNILFPIMGYTEMLMEDTPDDSPVRPKLNEILTGAMRAKDLVQQILTFARQESSELKLMKMQPIIKEALKLIRSTIPTTIEIKQDIKSDCGVIKADPTQIHQIIMNLATNACHAMEKTRGVMKIGIGEVELEALDIKAPNMRPGIYICLTVADTGIGMQKNVAEKIFDPFFTTKEIGKGTGMGLSVVHGIVTGLGGAIQVYSEPGKGTEFKVYFPAEERSPEKPEVKIKEPIQGGVEKILLVDDEQGIIEMEKQMLERLGYQVTSRINSTEALELFRAAPDRFDLVITDMAMPNLPGDRLAAELLKIRSNIPILLCTGFSETVSEESAASLGIKDFLMKPIVMRDLANKIRKVLDTAGELHK